MNFNWDPAKNEANQRKHGISFEVARHIFDGSILTRVDDRREYGENRDIRLGVLSPETVFVVVHTKRADKIRLITARKENVVKGKVYYDHLKQAFEGN